MNSLPEIIPSQVSQPVQSQRLDFQGCQSISPQHQHPCKILIHFRFNIVTTLLGLAGRRLRTESHAEGFNRFSSQTP